MSDMATPKEQQTAYQRWEMSSFAQNPKDAGSFNHKRREPANAPSKVAEIFESVRQEAYTKGMQEGFAVGMAKAKEVTQRDAAEIFSHGSSFW